MSYIIPADYPISDDFQEHKDRNSKEPGTDYATPYGTPIQVAGAGVVTTVDHSNSGAAGRRLTVDLYDGRRVSYIHLSRIGVQRGDHVNAGEFVAESGASGFGKDWYYGPHVHVSLWAKPGMSFTDTIDFEQFTVVSSGGNAINREEDEMPISYINVTGAVGKRRGGCYAVMRDSKGSLFARFISPTKLKGVPTVQNGRALTDLQKTISGLA